jgi:hypothetical protein
MAACNKVMALRADPAFDDEAAFNEAVAAREAAREAMESGG